jgi:hypothetical protein
MRLTYNDMHCARSQVWHEKWGEDYAKGGEACLKWTDRWSETQLEGGRQITQGDKWREEFGRGTGNKTGETWHVNADGHRCDFVAPVAGPPPVVLLLRMAG